jgi:hypothetical protein
VYAALKGLKKDPKGKKASAVYVFFFLEVFFLNVFAHTHTHTHTHTHIHLT